MTEGAGASNVPDEPGRLLSREAIDAGYALAREDIGRFNLGLFGLTGVGKSTLLNAVFGADLAATGIGDPVTQDAKLYRYDTSNLGIFDTKGLELGSDMASILEAFVGFVDANRMGGLDDQIHVIWYCIRAGDRRIQPAEEAFIGKVADIGIPVLLVMTQTPLTADGEIHQDAVVLADAIRELRLPIRGDVRFVNAKADDFSGVPSHGLDELLEATSAVAPEGVRNALAAAQQVDRKFKRARAQSLIDGAAPKLQGRVLLRGVDQVWAELFAGIAEVYDMPEERSREVLDGVAGPAGAQVHQRRGACLPARGRAAPGRGQQTVRQGETSETQTEGQGRNQPEGRRRRGEWRLQWRQRHLPAVAPFEGQAAAGARRPCRG